MTKNVNTFGQYVLKSDKGKCLTDGETCTKTFITGDEAKLANWQEVDESEADYSTELTETEEKAQAYDILMGVAE